MYGNFSFYFDSEIVFGKNTETETGSMIKKYGGTNVMIVFGAGSIKKSGLYDRVIASLTDNCIMYTEIGGVQPNPRRSLAEKGVLKALESKVDFVLGIGGGSVIDTAKAIALGAANNGDFWQFYQGKAPEKMLPVGTIITIAASGSETSRSCVLVDDIDSNLKKGLWSKFRPRFAIMNPELTYSLSPFQTAAGCVDILSHTFMRYFSNYSSYLGDRYGEATMQTIIKYTPIAISDPENYEARAEILLAGSLSHSDLMMIGRPGSSAGGEHALESQLSGYYNTTHGAGLAVIMPSLLKYFVNHGSPEQISRVAVFAEKVFSVIPDSANNAETATLGIEAFIQWLKDINMPTTLSGLGIPETEIPDAVRRCMLAYKSTIEGFMTLNETAVMEIYNEVMH